MTIVVFTGGYLRGVSQIKRGLPTIGIGHIAFDEIRPASVDRRGTHDG